jgi:hypothetical protein
MRESHQERQRRRSSVLHTDIPAFLVFLGSPSRPQVSRPQPDSLEPRAFPHFDNGSASRAPTDAPRHNRDESQRRQLFDPRKPNIADSLDYSNNASNSKSRGLEGTASSSLDNPGAANAVEDISPGERVKSTDECHAGSVPSDAHIDSGDSRGSEARLRVSQ